MGYISNIFGCGLICVKSEIAHKLTDCKQMRVDFLFLHSLNVTILNFFGVPFQNSWNIEIAEDKYKHLLYILGKQIDEIKNEIMKKIKDFVYLIYSSIQHPTVLKGIC